MGTMFELMEASRSISRQLSNQYGMERTPDEIADACLAIQSFHVVQATEFANNVRGYISRNFYYAASVQDLLKQIDRRLTECA